MAAEYFCVTCRTPFQNHFPLDESGRCRLCRAGARGFDAAYCFGSYEGTLRELIHLFKYGRMKPLARALAANLASALPRDQKFDVVVPMPLHWRRKWQRGFNQAELLARRTARRCGIPVANAVRRIRPTSAQAGLSNAQRRENVAGGERPPALGDLPGHDLPLLGGAEMPRQQVDGQPGQRDNQPDPPEDGRDQRGGGPETASARGTTCASMAHRAWSVRPRIRSGWHKGNVTAWSGRADACFRPIVPQPGRGPGPAAASA